MKIYTYSASGDGINLFVTQLKMKCFHFQHAAGRITVVTITVFEAAPF